MADCLMITDPTTGEAKPVGVIQGDASDIKYDNDTSVKEKIDEISSYFTEEKRVGTWIDGKPLYEKTVDCGAMPNNTVKQVNHNISDLFDIVEIKGTVLRTGAGGATSIFTLPYIFTSSNAVQYASLSANRTVIAIQDTIDLSAYDQVYVTLRYTKSTD